MLKKKIRENRIFVIIVLLTMISSCKPSLDKDEYKVINKVIEKTIYPKADQRFVTKLMEKYNIEFDKADDLANNEVIRENFTFTISDTLFPIKLSKELKEDLHNKFLFYEIENRSDKVSIIDFTRINFNNQTKRIDKATDDIHYMGHFKLHRVLFDKTRERAYVQIETPEINNPLFTGIMLKKENGEWILD